VEPDEAEGRGAAGRRHALGGQVALVTGAARGIGLAFAARLAELGAAVVAVERDLDGAEADLQSVLAVAPDSFVAVADASDEEAMQAVAEDAVNRWGRIDIAVCNAGGSGGWISYASELQREEVLGVYALNVLTATATVRAVVPHMRAQGQGKIVTVSSLAGVSAYNDGWLAAYGMAKAALVQYTRYLAQELGRDGITANVLAPGPTATDRFVERTTREHMEELAAQTALGRLASPTDQAGVLEFLVTGLSDYVTGQVITVEGGSVRGPR